MATACLFKFNLNKNRWQRRDREQQLTEKYI